MASLTGGQSMAQLDVDDTIPVEVLVQDIFNTGVFVSVNNITLNGIPAEELTHQQIGYFENGFDATLPIDSGIALATHKVRVPFLALVNDGPLEEEEYLDADVATLVAGAEIEDCAVLEFDAVSEVNGLAFTYSFASQEYQNFTCTEYNDAFGLFVSGPGIDGPYSEGAVNIATIPGSDVAVSINTVNGGEPTGDGIFGICWQANPNFVEDSQYFVENYNNAISPVYFKGWTVPFEALIQVQPLETYHFKLAICDVVDAALASAVMLEANSFEGRFLTSTLNQKTTELPIYPNPAKESAFIDLPEEHQGEIWQLRIRDNSGRVVRTQALNTSEIVEIPVSDLEKGMYLIEVFSASGRIGVAKLVRD